MLEIVYGWLVMSGIMEMIISIRKKSNKKTSSKSRDQHSLALLWIGTTIGVSSAIAIREIRGFWFSESIYLVVGGLSTASIGILIRLVAISQLKDEFTVDVSIVPDHQLKTDGMYRLVRHPSYSGLILNFLGAGIAINNLWSMGLIVIPVTLALVNRIRIEERLLVESFGESYRTYRKKTWAMFPYIF